LPAQARERHLDQEKLSWFSRPIMQRDAFHLISASLGRK
jgi:hypothetical protein